MPTTVRFSGAGGDSITVEESPQQILEELRERHGNAVLLTLNGAHAGVYVNPDRIACWHPSSGSSEPHVVSRPFMGPI